MSSMRNAVARRPHRERAQPLERRRLGLLEKHKDYSLRAKDYNKKQAQLKSLRNKAADRNEDEFYFGMMSRKGPGSRIQSGKRWDGTVEGDRGNKAMDMETVRLLKTQDIGYVRTMKQMAVKEVRKLEEQYVLTRGLDHLDDEDEQDDGGMFDDSENEDSMPMPAKPQATGKIMFMDDEDEREGAMHDQLDREEQAEEEGEQEDKKRDDAEDERAKSTNKLKKQLEQARRKLKALTDAEEQLEIQKAKMAKTATSGGHTRKGKKIMVRTRKR
jgi:U3 small nucleolar RNA-associated protein 11